MKGCRLNEIKGSVQALVDLDSQASDLGQLKCSQFSPAPFYHQLQKTSRA